MERIQAIDDEAATLVHEAVARADELKTAWAHVLVGYIDHGNGCDDEHGCSDNCITYYPPPEGWSGFPPAQPDHRSGT